MNVEQGELKNQEAMSEDLLGNGQPGGHEHARPVHRMEAQDVLAHNVNVGRPAAGLQLLGRWLQALWKKPCRQATFILGWLGSALAGLPQSFSQPYRTPPPVTSLHFEMRCLAET